MKMTTGALLLALVLLAGCRSFNFEINVVAPEKATQQAGPPAATATQPVSRTIAPFDSRGAGFTPALVDDPPRCVARNTSGSDVLLHRWPGVEYDTTATLRASDAMVVWGQSQNGWYQLIVPGIGWMGWVPAAMVTLTGACDTIFVPTPTQAAFPGLTPIPEVICRVSSATGTYTPVYSQPDAGAAITGRIDSGDLYPATFRTNDGWYRIEYRQGIGWVYEGNVHFNGPCNTLPLAN